MPAQAISGLGSISVIIRCDVGTLSKDSLYTGLYVLIFVVLKVDLCALSCSFFIYSLSS